MRKKEFPHLYMDLSEKTDLAMNNNTETQIQILHTTEPEAKATCIVKEYNEDESDDDYGNNGHIICKQRESINLNLSSKTKFDKNPIAALMKYNPDDDYANRNDPYRIRRREEAGPVQLDENAQKMIEDFKKEFEMEKIQEDEKKAKQEKL